MASVLVASAQVTRTVSSQNASLSVTFDGTNVSWSRSLARTGDNTLNYYGGVWLYRVASNGATAAQAVIFDVGGGSLTYGAPPTVVTGSFTASSGQWYLLAARTVRGPANVVHEGPSYIWFQIGTLDPLTVSVLPNSQSVQVGSTINFTASASSAGTPVTGLVYTWSATGGSIIGTGATATYTPPASVGNYTISVYAAQQASYSQSNTAIATANVVEGLAQTVTINPTSGTAGVKESSTFTASGGQNGYSWSLSGGGGLGNNGASAGVLWNSPGTWTVKVWSPAGNGYSRSNEATATITVTGVPDGSKKVNLTFDNRSRNYPVKFTVWQDGKAVTSLVVAGGQVVIRTVTVPNGNPVTVTAQLKDGETDIYTDTPNPETVVGTYTPTDLPGSTPDDATPPEPDVPQPDPEEPPEQTDEAPKGSPALPDKVSSATRQLIQKAVDAAQAAGEKAKVEGNAVVGKFGTVDTDIPTSPSLPESGVHDLGTIGGKHLTILKNPFSQSGPFGGIMASVAGFVKKLIAWGLVAAFVIWAFGHVRLMVMDIFHVSPMANSLDTALNSVKILGTGGGWGYAARIVLFIVLVVVVLAMPVAITAAMTAGLPWSTITATVELGAPTSSGLGSMFTNALALTNQVIPWAMLMVTPAWYIACEFLLFPSRLFWVFFMKFLPS